MVIMDFPFIAMCLGMVSGVIGGMLPGVGHLLCLILLLPWLVKFSAIEIFVCFVVMVQVSQFLGSLTTVFTRVPGEISSLPMIEELKNVPADRLGEVISSTAVGSIFGMVMALILCYLMIDWLDWFSFFFRTELMLILILTAVATIFYHARGSVISKIGLAILGLLLGLVGYNQNLETTILTMGYTNLMGGIPVTVVLICLFALPQLYQIRNLSLLHQDRDIAVPFTWKTLKIMPTSSMLGFFGGMMPGLATLFSSQIAYNWAKSRTVDPVQRITASETANNAGAISQMIPMLILGLPILSSEALALGLMESRGFSASIQVGSLFLSQALLPLAITAVVALLLAWPLATFTIALIKIDLQLLRIAAMLFLCAVLFYQAYTEAQILFVLGCFSSLAMLGWFLRNHDTSLLVFLFLLGDLMLDHVWRFVVLYF